ncbi:MerR family transcriptional regulator [Candidatus Dependentiae bacterium]|nr:MerR family transcriptional regulator [Candidatus Dependentiae bacterium]
MFHNIKKHMNRKKFRIGDLSEKLQVKKFVIRFWEKEFELKSDRSEGGQRFYTQKDLQIFSAIKELLYEKKYTIPGAKKELLHFLNEKSNTNKEIVKTSNMNSIQPAHKENYSKDIENKKRIPEKFFKELKALKQKLINFKKQLD